MGGKYFYRDLDKIPTLSVFFGGRGTGKTFCFLKQIVEHAVASDRRYMWLRETKAIVDIIKKGNSLTAPIEKVDPDFPAVMIESGAGVSEFWTYHMESDEKTGKDKPVQDGKIGYLAALSTFSNARGIDFSDVDWIVFDEFIPEDGTVQRKYMGEKLLNLYETVNRNREMEGEQPVKLVMLTNTNTPFSEYLSVFGLDEIIDDLKKGYYRDKDVLIEFCSNKDFRDEKASTFLYRRAKSQRFLSMALDNDFSISKALVLKKPSLKGSKPLFCVGDSQTYVCTVLSDGKMYFRKGFNKDLQFYDMSDEQQEMLFRFLFTDKLRHVYIRGAMYFDSIYTQKAILEFAKLI